MKSIKNRIKEASLKKRSTSFSAIIVMTCTLLSRLLGFVRIALISFFFGASQKADILNFTFNIPNNLRKLMAEGALSSAFIPTLSQSLINDESQKSSKKLVQNILTFQIIILVPLCILSIIFSENIITFLSQFKDRETILIATKLFRYFVNYILLVSISAVIIATLNANDSFLVPALAPISFSIFVISSILIFHKSLGIFSMAIGVLSGGIAQILIQLPMFFHKGYNLNLNFRFNNEYFKKVMVRWFPVLATSSVFVINQIIANFLATGLDYGSVSALSNSIVFWQLPSGIFAASLSTVLFPKMSRQAAKNDIEGLKNSINYGLSFLFLLLIPSAIVLIFLGPHIISASLQRGMFTLENTILTSKVLKFYAIGLFSVGVYNFLQRFFYSVNKFYIPLLSALLVVSIDIVLSIILMKTRLKVMGLALANSIAFSVVIIFLLFFVFRELKGLSLKMFFLNSIKVIFSIIPLIIFLLIITFFDKNYWIYNSSLYSFILTTFIGLFSVILTGLSFYIFKIDIFTDIIKRRR